MISADDGGRRQENRVNEVGAISRGLKQLAKEIGAPVLCCVYDHYVHICASC
ncbi:MAG: hypothetical protein II708_04640 [Paludibacteraceae bacterium]|nr:hypothetical protein [Paludibacteraceae bacterium]